MSRRLHKFLSCIRFGVAAAAFGVVCGQVSAQSFDSVDMTLISTVRTAAPAPARVVSYGFGEKGSANPVYHLFSASMYGYQRWVSPVLGRHCAFSPSCSAYSKALLRRYGMLKGICCTADRLMRCNRIALSDSRSHWLLQEGDGLISDDVNRYSLRP